MKGISLDAHIRRKESFQALKEGIEEPLPAFLGFGKKSHLSQTPDTPPETDQLKKFKNQLLDIDHKKRQHLAVPKPKGSHFLKFSTLLIVLLFSLASLCFFAGGYLFSYTNPPPGSALSVTSSSSQGKAGWRIGMVIDTPPAHQESNAIAPSTYLKRRTYLQNDQALAHQVYNKGQSSTSIAIEREAKRLARKTTSKIKSAIRKVVGTSVANIFNPLSSTIVNKTVGGVVGKTSPEKKTQKGSAAISTLPSGQNSLTKRITSRSPIKSPSSALTAQPVGALFALELQTFLDSTDAFLFMRTLKAKGYSATYVVRARAGDNIIYKVRIGNFSNYTSASETRKAVGYPSRVVLATKNDDPLTY